MARDSRRILGNLSANGTEFDDVFKLREGDEDDVSAASEGVVTFSPAELVADES